MPLMYGTENAESQKKMVAIWITHVSYGRATEGEGLTRTTKAAMERLIGDFRVLYSVVVVVAAMVTRSVLLLEVIGDCEDLNGGDSEEEGPSGHSKLEHTRF